MISEHQILAGHVAAFSERKQRRKNGDGGVDEEPVYAVLGNSELGVVEIIGVNRNTVHKGREARGSLPCCANDGGLTVTDTYIFQILTAQSSGLCFRSG